MPGEGGHRRPELTRSALRRLDVDREPSTFVFEVLVANLASPNLGARIPSAHTALIRHLRGCAFSSMDDQTVRPVAKDVPQLGYGRIYVGPSAIPSVKMATLRKQPAETTGVQSERGPIHIMIGATPSESATLTQKRRPNGRTWRCEL